jgi:transcriptional regulator with XRE-family HTH domain
MAKVGARVTSLRIARNMRPSRLADLASMTEKRLKDIELGAAEPKLVDLMAISDGLGINIDQLLQGIKPMEERLSGRPALPRRQ